MRLKPGRMTDTGKRRRERAPHLSPLSGRGWPGVQWVTVSGVGEGRNCLMLCAVGLWEPAYVLEISTFSCPLLKDTKRPAQMCPAHKPGSPKVQTADISVRNGTTEKLSPLSHLTDELQRPVSAQDTVWPSPGPGDTGLHPAHPSTRPAGTVASGQFWKQQ